MRSTSLVAPRDRSDKLSYLTCSPARPSRHDQIANIFRQQSRRKTIQDSGREKPAHLGTKTPPSSAIVTRSKPLLLEDLAQLHDERHILRTALDLLRHRHKSHTISRIKGAKRARSSSPAEHSCPGNYEAYSTHKHSFLANWRPHLPGTATRPSTEKRVDRSAHASDSDYCVRLRLAESTDGLIPTKPENMNGHTQREGGSSSQHHSQPAYASYPDDPQRHIQSDQATQPATTSSRRQLLAKLQRPGTLFDARKEASFEPSCISRRDWAYA